MTGVELSEDLCIGELGAGSTKLRLRLGNLRFQREGEVKNDHAESEHWNRDQA